MKSNRKTNQLFFEQLGMLLTAGLDLKSSLLLIGESRNKKLIYYSNSIIDSIERGSSLFEAMNKVNDFSKFALFLCKVGEESGSLGLVCTRLGEYFHKNNDYKKQLLSSLIYPFSVLIISLFVFGFMIFFVVPMFNQIYEQFEAPLPSYTQWLISISIFFNSNAKSLLIITALLGLTLCLIYKKIDPRNINFDFLIQIPFLNSVYTSFLHTVLSNSMGLMLSSSIPFQNALLIAKDIIPSKHIQTKLSKVYGHLKSGKSISTSFQLEEVLPQTYISMLNISESIKSVDEIFIKIAKIQEKDLENKSNIFGKIFEPILIIFISTFVGGILLALYVPLFNLSSVIG